MQINCRVESTIVDFHHFYYQLKKHKYFICMKNSSIWKQFLVCIEFATNQTESRIDLKFGLGGGEMGPQGSNYRRNQLRLWAWGRGAVHSPKPNKIMGPLSKNLENDWKAIKFYEKLEREMSDLLRYSPYFSPFSWIFFLTHPSKNWIPWK